MTGWRAIWAGCVTSSIFRSSSGNRFNGRRVLWVAAAVVIGVAFCRDAGENERDSREVESGKAEVNAAGRNSRRRVWRSVRCEFAATLLKPVIVEFHYEKNERLSRRTASAAKAVIRFRFTRRRRTPNDPCAAP